MNKFICLTVMLMVSTGIIFSQNKETDKGFLVFYDILYNSEKIDSDPKFTTEGLNISAGFGYDFGSITINILTDIMLFERIRYQGYGYSREVQINKANNLGMEINLGIKLVNGRIFDLVLPIGGSIRGSDFEVTHGDERKFQYAYINVESGLIFSWHFTPFFAVCLPFNIGYPVYKKSKVENYTEKDYEVFHCSFGFGFQINLSKYFGSLFQGRQNTK